MRTILDLRDRVADPGRSSGLGALVKAGALILRDVRMLRVARDLDGAVSDGLRIVGNRLQLQHRQKSAGRVCHRSVHSRRLYRHLERWSDRPAEISTSTVVVDIWPHIRMNACDHWVDGNMYASMTQSCLPKGPHAGTRTSRRRAEGLL